MSEEIPKRIFLQIRDSISEDGATWCVDQINETDEEYVHISSLTEAHAELDRERQAGRVLDKNRVRAAVVTAINEARAGELSDEENIQSTVATILEAQQLGGGVS